MNAFFTATDNLGTHWYFKSLEAAQGFQIEHGGYILMTKHNRIWRVTKH